MPRNKLTGIIREEYCIIFNIRSCSRNNDGRPPSFTLSISLSPVLAVNINSRIKKTEIIV
jgi:hypothetical protein